MTDKEDAAPKPRKRRTLSVKGDEVNSPQQEELALNTEPTEAEEVSSAKAKDFPLIKNSKPKPKSKSRKKDDAKHSVKTEIETAGDGASADPVEQNAGEKIAELNREVESSKTQARQDAENNRIQAENNRVAKADAMTGPVAIAAMQNKRRGSLPTLQMNDYAERLPYVVLILAGFCLIILVKTLTDIPSWVVTGGAVFAIVGYGIFAGLRQQNRMRIDRIGDNCYYLGLTYTLASLISALFGLAGEDVGQRLLEDFGIALGSTAAGVIMRMVLMQFREELDDIETDARLALTQETKEFESQLRRARQDLDDYKHTIISSVAETHRQLADLLKLQVVNLSERNIRVADNLDKRLTETDAFLEAFAVRSDALLKTAEMLDGATGELASRMNKIDTQPDLLKTAFDKIGEGLKAIENSLINTAESLDKTSKSIETRNQGANEFMALSERLEARVGALDGTFEKITTNLQRQIEAVEKGSQVMEAHVAAMKVYTDAAELEGERMRKATASVYEALGSLASTVTQESRRGV